MTTYELGTVAVATVRGVEGVRVMRSVLADGSLCWTTAELIRHAGIHDDPWVTDIRPLVTLDLGLDAVSSAQVGSDVSGAAYVVRALRDSAEAGYDRTLNALADQIEAQTRPPRIPEPGLWGVVESPARANRSVRRWVRYGMGWKDGFGNAAVWDDLIDPVLIREGLS